MRNPKTQKHKPHEILKLSLLQLLQLGQKWIQAEAQSVVQTSVRLFHAQVLLLLLDQPARSQANIKNKLTTGYLSFLPMAQ